MKVTLWGGPEDGKVVKVGAYTDFYIPEGGADRGVYTHCPLHVPPLFEWRPVQPEESE